MGDHPSQEEQVYRPPRGSGDTSPDISDLIAANKAEAARGDFEDEAGEEHTVRRRDTVVIAAAIALSVLFLGLGWVLWHQLDAGYEPQHAADD